MHVLLTGGAGYIGSHTAIELLSQGHRVSILDNFSNSSPDVVGRIQEITGVRVDWHHVDATDEESISRALGDCEIDACIHFAGSKAVAESVNLPLDYYRNNLMSMISLLSVMKNRGINKLIFSSSATVYGTAADLPLTEDSPTGVGIANPYGQTKFMSEQIIADAVAADPALSATVLRYFNPVGAHPSGRIGEAPPRVPNNLVPYVGQVANGERPFVSVFGDDYETPDGTGVRDYIHVVDLARGHVSALEAARPGVATYNLGTGVGVSVLEVITAFAEVIGRPIPYRVMPRRAGDVAVSLADASRAEVELGWKPAFDFRAALEDAWRWQTSSALPQNA